jgi:hypothetical protein
MNNGWKEQKQEDKNSEKKKYAHTHMLIVSTGNKRRVTTRK